MGKVKYSCPAVPPEGITLNTLYDVGKDAKGSFYTDGKIKVYEDDKIIKMLFTPLEESKPTK